MAFKMSSREPLLPNTDEENNFYDRTHLLELPNVRSTVRFRGPSAGTRLQIARTVNLCLSFFGLGLCFAIPNPTLEDLRKAANTDMDSIYYIYTARSCGYLLGAIAGGVLFDRYNRQFLLFLSHLATAVGILVMPFCTELGALMACTAITGITMAFLDTGGNVWCLDLWGKKSAPILQTLHFCFGLGAFVAPLVADPFLSPHGFHPQSMLTGQTLNYGNSTAGMVVPPVGIHPVHHRVSHRILPEPSPQFLDEADASWHGDSIEKYHIVKRDASTFNQSANFSLSKPDNSGEEFANVTTLNSEKLGVSSNLTDDFTSNNYTDAEASNSSLNVSAKDVQLTTESVSVSTPKHRPKPAITNGETLPNAGDKWARKKDSKLKQLKPSSQMDKKTSTTTPTPALVSNDTKSSLDDNTTLADAALTNSSSDNSTSNNVSTPISPNLKNSSEQANKTTLLQPKATPINVTTVAQPSVPTYEPSSTLSTNLLSTVSAVHHDLTTPQISTVKPKISENVTTTKEVVATTHIPTTKGSAEMLSTSTTTVALPIPKVSEQPEISSTKSPASTTVKPLLNNNSLVITNTSSTSTTTTPTVKSTLESDNASSKPGPIHRVKDTIPTLEKEDDIDPTLESQANVNSEDITTPRSTIDIDVDQSNQTNSSQIANNRSDDFFTRLYQSINQRRLGKFEFVYVILGTYIFVVAIVFLIFLCLNPREPRSKQEEETDRSRHIGRGFVIGMVVLLSLFLCLYTGIEVAVGQLLQTFATKEQLRLPWSKAYFLPKLFWGSFAFARFVSILLALKLRGFVMLVIDMVVCLAASILLVAGADKEETLLWVGIVILGLGLSSVFPTSIVWVERYIHVTNKAAATFIVGTAIGQIAVPLIINRFIDQEPMVLMYVTLVVSVLCFVTFIAIWRMALRYGEKYSSKPDRCLYQLANADDVDDVLEMAPAHANNHHSWQPLKRKLERT